MQNKNKLVISKSNNPWLNLAAEEFMLSSNGENSSILYLWQNANTVVIGRNQNPWLECRSEELEKNGGMLARRLSGGGAVYHDLGNLNFTFILNKKDYDLRRQVGVLLEAVKLNGINAVFSGRNDMVLEDGRKFSGNAFCFRGNNAYHHGTLLVNTDFKKLTGILTVSKDKIDAKGIKSIRSRVGNLNELNPELTVPKLQDSVISAFEKEYGKIDLADNGFDNFPSDAIEKLYSKYSSWEWRYGEAPKFDIEISNKFSWGGVSFCMKIKNGIIDYCHIYSDAMDADFIDSIANAVKGKRLTPKDLSESVVSTSEYTRNDASTYLDIAEVRKIMINDISGWIQSKSF